MVALARWTVSPVPPMAGMALHAAAWDAQSRGLAMKRIDDWGTISQLASPVLSVMTSPKHDASFAVAT